MIDACIEDIVKEGALVTLESQCRELQHLELALVGGGVGEVIFG